MRFKAIPAVQNVRNSLKAITMFIACFRDKLARIRITGTGTSFPDFYRRVRGGGAEVAGQASNIDWWFCYIRFNRDGKLRHNHIL